MSEQNTHNEKIIDGFVGYAIVRFGETKELLGFVDNISFKVVCEVLGEFALEWKKRFRDMDEKMKVKNGTD